jgi:hypothetical protein
MYEYGKSSTPNMGQSREIASSGSSTMFLHQLLSTLRMTSWELQWKTSREYASFTAKAIGKEKTSEVE